MSMHIRSEGSPTYTEDFTRLIADLTIKQIPPTTIHAAKRGILDWLGCALVGSQHSTPQILIKTLLENQSAPQAALIGKKEKMSFVDAAIVNGQMGHVLDFDDTHMGGVVLHASSPILAALLSEIQRPSHTTPITGENFLLSYICGFECGVRVGQSAPDHHPGGWHLTGTLGHFAAAIAVGKMNGLSANALTHSMGIAGTQASGMQQNRGTMCKSFHAGRAASNGLLAARLAKNGFDSSLEILEGKRGFLRIYSKTASPERMTENLGQSWEIERNGFKPYACGVVLHPAIDAAIALGQKYSGSIHRIQKLIVKVHPLVISITGNQDPKTGLHSKFSIYHSVAVAFLDLEAGIAQYMDERLDDDNLKILREKIIIEVDETLQKDQASATLITSGVKDNNDAMKDILYDVFIEHARGTVDHPLSDVDLEKKFLSNAQGVISANAANEIISRIWQIEKESNLARLVDLLQEVS